MSTLKLHPKFGANPTLAVCLWCGQDRGDLALLGAAYKGEAPMRMVIDIEPCKDCADKFSQGITFFEAHQTPRENTLRIGANVWVTGRYVVVTEAFVKRVLTEEAASNALRMRRALVDPEVFESLLPRTR